MQIIKKGKDVSYLGECSFCGCKFIALPDDMYKSETCIEVTGIKDDNPQWLERCPNCMIMTNMTLIMEEE